MSINRSRYGTWPSLINSSLLTTDSVSLDELQLHHSACYWIEKRPSESGRCAIVKYEHDNTVDLLPGSFSARSRVHEYGGGVYCITDTGVYFVNDKDQNIYFIGDNRTPVAITHSDHASYADLQFDEHRQQIICIMQNSDPDNDEDINTLVSINPVSGACQILHSGNDFYSNPRLSPCGNQLCWLSWDHPDMPWDSTQLWLANINNHSLSSIRLITHSQKRSVSCFQPEWSADNILHFISDVTGWWNLYSFINNNIVALTALEQELGRPQWVFSQSAYSFIGHSHILCAPIDKGITRLSILDRSTNTLTTLDKPWRSISSLQSSREYCYFIAASENSFPEIICLDPETLEHISIKTSCRTVLSGESYSQGQVIKFTSRHHDDVYAIYYQPLNISVVADNDEKPPLIVLTHGGPTAMSEPSLDLRKQYWTSRGFAVLDINYSGSTGFGRTYRKRLDHNWGIRDAEDCCDAAMHMVSMGLADPERLIIKGSSAGGYTVLCALAFHQVFTAGACYYGIGNLESLLKHTHKFESRYLHRLIGSYPQHKKRYHERSPLNYAAQLNCPVIFFQGTEDKVVPMEQTEKMYAALMHKGVPVSCIYFPGEQHGFRKAETIQTAIDTEYAFYTKIFNLDAETTVPVHIDNFNT